MDGLAKGIAMMHTKRLHLCFAILAELAAFGISASAQAGAITPWSGASASVQVLDQTQTDVGTSASAVASGDQWIPFHNTVYPDRETVYHAHVWGTASAQATGQANNLLNLDAEYRTSNPGTSPGGYQEPIFSSSASWTGDSIQLQTPEGANLPNQIRLNFGLSYQVHDYWGWQGFRTGDPKVTVIVNGSQWTIQGSGVATGLSHNEGHQVVIDNVSSSPPLLNTAYAEDYGMIGVEAAFHLDLPIDSKGVSLPFSLALSMRVDDGLAPNTEIWAGVKDLNLSLKDITLLDGTSLTDAGYGVSFASGMAWPQPHAVPEPASGAVWAGLAAAAGWWRFGKKRRIM